MNVPGKGGKMSAAHRETLARIVARDPAAGYQAIRAEFRGLTGRDVSSPTVTRARRAAPESESQPARPGTLKPRMAGPWVGLVDSERGILRALLESHPTATPGQVRKMFRHRAGREVSLTTVRRYRAGRSALKPWYLSDSERSLLARIVMDSAPDFNRTEIRDEFLALAGRGISIAEVSRFIRGPMGMPRGRDGQPSGARRDKADDAIGRAVRRKFAEAPVDRSVRVGHASKARETTS